MNVRARLREYVSSNVSAPLDDDSDFFELGLVDSLFALQLVTFVEQEFAIAIEPEDLDIAHFSSITALDEFISNKLA